MFHLVFVGDKGFGTGWTREPGSWWATRKHLFTEFRGVYFEDGIFVEVERIRFELGIWNKKNDGNIHTSKVEKRAFSESEKGLSTSLLDCHRRVKREFKQQEQFMSDKWRQRRRLQQKKAGRWTDGTLRMNRMWGEFHWVCDEDGKMMAVSKQNSR